MDSAEPTDELELEVARLRAALHDDRTVPLGMVSRLHAAVAREAGADAPIGWEPRIVIACLAYVALGSGAAPTTVPGGSLAMTAVVALAYAFLASWPVRRVRRSRPSA